MFNLKSLKNIGFPLYFFVYLIFPYSAISQSTKINLRRNLENALNTRDVEFIKQSFNDDQNLIIPKKFSKIINEFPDSKWKIKRLKSTNLNENIFQIRVIGKKSVDGEIYIL